MIFVTLLSSSEISVDDDVFWHLASGRYIVTNHSIPSTDVFGHVSPETKWIPFEWGWEVLTYLVFQISGYEGISILRTFLVLTIYGIIFSLIIRLRLNINISAIILFAASFSLMSRFTPRPHLVTYVFLLLVLYLIIHVRYLKKDKRIFYFLPLIFLVLGNMHVNGIIGIIVFGIYIFSELAEKYLARNKKTSFLSSLKKDPLFFSVKILALSFICLFLNPFTIETYIFEYGLMNLKLLENINEWRSPFTTSDFSFYVIIYLFFILLGAASVFYGIKKKDYFIICIFCFSVIYSMQAVRFTFDFFILNLVFILMSLSYIAGNFRPEKLKDLFNKNKTVSYTLSAILLFTSFGIYNNYLYKNILNTSFRETGMGINEKYYPVELIRFVKENKINETGLKVYNSLNCGGFFIWNCEGSKNFIDTRNLSDNLYNEYKSIDNKKAGFESKLDNYGIDYIIYSFPYGTQNARVMERSLISYLIKKNNDWKLIFWDDKSFLFVKNLPKFKDLINKFEFRYVHPYNLVFNFSSISGAAKTDRLRMINELERKIKEEPSGIFINDLARRIKFL